MSRAFWRLTVTVVLPPGLIWIPFFKAGRNRGIVTLTEYSPAKRLGMKKDPRLSVNDMRSGINGLAAVTTTRAPTTGTPPESRTLPLIAARVPDAFPTAGDNSSATPIAIMTEQRL